MKPPAPDERSIPVPDRDPLTWGKSGHGGDARESRDLVRSALIFYAILGAVGVIWIELARSPIDWGRLLLGPRPFFAMGLGLAAGLLMVLISRLLANWRPIERLFRQFVAVLGKISPKAAFLLAASSAIGEELIFRGAAQPWLGLWVTSTLFAIVHVPLNRHFIAWPIFAFGGGLIMGSCAEVSESLLAPIVAHFTVNWLNLRAIGRAASPL